LLFSIKVAIFGLIWIKGGPLDVMDHIGSVVGLVLQIWGPKTSKAWFNCRIDHHWMGAEYLLTLKIHPCNAPNANYFTLMT